MNTILKAKNISAGYNKVSIISGINIEISYGSLIAVIGTNGAGKSTLLRTLMGLQEPLSGNIYINDKDIYKIDSQALATKVSCVFSKQILGYGLNVKQLVTLGRLPHLPWHGRLSLKDKEIVNNILKENGLSTYADRDVNSLSDGELQRVMVARALAQQAPMMILDEPTSHLDLAGKVELSLMLRNISRNSDCSVIFSTHDLDLAIQVADFLWVIHNGITHFDTVEALAESGVLSSIFPENLIHFDKDKLRFII